VSSFLAIGKFFYVTKVGKIHLGVFIIGKMVNFHSAQFWNFPIRGSGVINGLKKHRPNYS
jgi:hypothetical protein